MKEKFIAEIIQEMLPHLDNAKLVQLKQVLEQKLSRYDVNELNGSAAEGNDSDLIEKFVMRIFTSTYLCRDCVC